MIKFTPFTKAASAAANWKRQYFDDRKGWKSTALRESASKIYDSLVDLGPSPYPEDVCRIIGNNTWTRCRCDECGKEVDAAVQLGEEPDNYDTQTAHICNSCLKKALSL